MTEIETIKAIRRLFPACPGQINQDHTADAELIGLAGGRYAFSIDEFSKEEDFFDDHDLCLLGQNLAVAVVSDILATGCRPRFYLQAITEPYDRDDFAVGISEGIRKILNDCHCYLLGGDLSRGENWRYTGVAVGQSLNKSEPLTRILPPRPQKLWLTGCLGDGNLCAFTGRDKTGFELRLGESEALAALATACLDTSGGLVESFYDLSLVNPKHRFNINSKALPYDPRVTRMAFEHQLPLAGFAFGGAGEYELLFSTDDGLRLDYATHIGSAEPDESPGVYWDAARLPDYRPDPRAFKDKKSYVNELLEFIKLCRL
jgi:thiamine-monophosphate kinase